MILPRILSSSSSKISSFYAIASLHYHSSFLPTVEISHQIRHHFSGKRRFDFEFVREADDAISLFHEMIRAQPRPSVIEFTKLLTAVLKLKQYSVALHLFDEMLHKDAPVNHYTLSIVIDCYCRLKRPDLGLAILGRFFKLGYEPTVVTFTTLINGYCKAGNTLAALHLLRALEETSCDKPNLYAYTAVINGLCKDGMVDDALQLFSSLADKGILPDVRTYSSIIRGLCILRRWNETEEMLKKMVVDEVYPDVVTCTILMDAYCKEGRLEAAQHIFQTIMPRINVRPDIVTYNIMLEALFREGRCEDGLNLFKEMEALQLISHTNTNASTSILIAYSILLNGLCSAHRIAEAFSVLRSMEEDKGIIPNIVTYTTLIDGLCKDNQVREAKDLFDKLPSKGLQPDAVTYTILIGALCKQGRIEEAKDLLKQMVNNGCLPDIVTYNVFVEALVERNRIGEAMPVLEEMNSRGFKLDGTTFGLIIQHWENEGIDSLLFLFDKVKKLLPKNMSPNNGK